MYPPILAPSHLYALFLLFLLSHVPLTLATRQFRRRIYPHHPAVQSLSHCHTAINLIPSPSAPYHIDRVNAGDIYSAAFHDRSCIILISSVVEKQGVMSPIPEAAPLTRTTQRPETTTLSSATQNTAAIHNEMWPRVIAVARDNVDPILLLNSAIELNERMDVEGGWQLRYRMSIRGVAPRPGGSAAKIFRISRG